uniref:WRKY domain-containing protein n=1 Tax=Fagus sylvatica TaxID=28930 RepID=A0A2N9ILW3_FAGSY
MEIHFQDGNKKTGRSMDQESIPELMESSKSEKNHAIISRDWIKISSPPERGILRTQVSRTIRRKDGQMQEKGESPPQQLPPQPQHLPPPGLVAATSSNSENNSTITSTNNNNSILVAARGILRTQVSRTIRRKDGQMQEKGESPPQQLPPQPQHLPPPGLVAATSLNSENNSTITSTNDNNSILVAARSSSSPVAASDSLRILVRRTIRVPAIGSNVADIPPDEYSWKKYIQKDIRGSSLRRVYYRCTNSFRGCGAMKHVRSASDDPTTLIITYMGEHNHTAPHAVLHANDAMPENLTWYKGDCPPQQLLPQPQQLPPPGEQTNSESEDNGTEVSQTSQPKGIQVEEMQTEATTLKPQGEAFTSGQMEFQIEDVDMESEASEQHGLFLMQGGLGLTKPPKDEDWENAEEIYLMDNELTVLPENPRTGIKFLPDSIVRLVGLKRLFLNDCHRFMRLSPKVGELKQLEVLDLEGTEIMDLPQEIEKLTNLTCLEVSFYGYTSDGRRAMGSNAVVPCGVISALSRLEELNINVNPDDERWDANVEAIVNEVYTLKRLETLKFYFPRVELLRHIQRNIPSLLHFRFTVGRHAKRIISRVPLDVEFELERWERCLKYINGVGVPREIKKLTTIFTQGLLANLCNLEELKVEDCPSINSIVSCKISAEHKTSCFLPNLKKISLHYMPGLVSISSGLHIAPKLEWLSFYNCPKLKNPFIEEVSSQDLKKIKGERSWWEALEWRNGHPGRFRISSNSYVNRSGTSPFSNGNNKSLPHVDFS